MKGASVGAVSEDEGGKKNGGEVGFFEYGGGSIWNQLDQDITGVAMHDRLGEAVAVAISGTCSGQFIAVSSPKNEDNCVLNSGKVDVYEYSEQSQLWIPEEEASIHSRCRCRRHDWRAWTFLEGALLLDHRATGNYYHAGASV